MQENYFDDYLKLMRSYIKTLRLSFNGKADWANLDALPSNYHTRAREIRNLLTEEYQTLPDFKWEEKIKYYKQAQDKFDIDHRQEGNLYCQYFVAKHSESLGEYRSADNQVDDWINVDKLQEGLIYYKKVRAKKDLYEKQYKQNQSYMDALIVTRKQINEWFNVTFNSREEKLLENNGLPCQTQRNTLEDLNTTKLSIVPGAKKGLYDALCEYVDEKDHQTLRDLIFKGTRPSSKIVVECLVKQVCISEMLTQVFRSKLTHPFSSWNHSKLVGLFICDNVLFSAHGFPFQVQPMGFVSNPIQNGIR